MKASKAMLRPGSWRMDDQMMREDGTGPLPGPGKHVCPKCGAAHGSVPADIQIYYRAERLDGRGGEQFGIGHLQSLDPAHEHDQFVALAQLIVRTPDLLSALDRLVTACENGEPPRPGAVMVAQFRRLVEEARQGFDD